MPLSAEQKARAVALHADGRGSQAIATQLGVSRNSIRAFLASHAATGPLASAPTSSTQPAASEAKPATPLPDRIRAAIAKAPMTVEALCDALESWPAAVKQALVEMTAQGVPVREAADGWRLDLAPAPDEREFRNDEQPDRVKLGLVSDTHLGSKMERLDVLERVYDLFAAEGVRDVLHVGDITDGWGVYRGHEFEAKVIGDTEQVEYACEHYPRRDGIRTRFISGNHDLASSKRGGSDPGPRIARDRPDLQYLGRYSAWVEIAKDVWIYLLHPDKGKSYATSYRVQKIVEALQRRPQIAAFGHWHVMGNFCPQGVYTIQAGCFQDQTEFERRLALAPDVGGWLLDIGLDGPRIVRFRPEWIAG